MLENLDFGEKVINDILRSHKRRPSIVAVKDITYMFNLDDLELQKADFLKITLLNDFDEISL